MNTRIATLATLLDIRGIDAPDAIQLLPAGTFRAQDGRPHDATGWVMDEKIAARLISQAQARRNPYPIDYEHQTIHAAQNGQPAPAAGWFKDLEWREGSGLWAVNVKWTERARAMIASGEYRYISPVFVYDKAGRILRLLHAALTNDPALDGMTALAALTMQKQEEPLMTEDTLALLGLNHDATSEQIHAAIVELKTRLEEAETQVAALKTSTVPMATVQELQAQVATLNAQVLARDVEDLIKPALADGRLLPSLEDWARELGHSDITALKHYLEHAQPIAALVSTQSEGRAPESTPALSDEELAVCTMLGQSPEDFAAFKAVLNKE